MTCFHDFSAPLWEIFTGNLLLLFCSLFYLVWWIIAFRPNSPGGTSGTPFIIAALAAGLLAVILLSIGISTLSNESKGLPVKFILLGGVVLFLVLLPVTSVVFHRSITSELLIILLWTIIELSALAVLYGVERVLPGKAVIISMLVVIALIAGLICYVLYYRLDKSSSYIVGMLPMIIDACVMSVFLGILATS